MQQLSPELLKLLGLDQHLATMVKALSVIPSLGAGGDSEKQRFTVMIVVKISKTTQVLIVKKSLWVVAWRWHLFRALKTQMK